MSRSPKSPSLFGTAEGRSQRKCLVRRSDTADEMAKNGSAITKTSKLAGSSVFFCFGRGALLFAFFMGVGRWPCSDSGRFLTCCRNHFLNAIYVTAGEEEAFFNVFVCSLEGSVLDTGWRGGFVLFLPPCSDRQGFASA